MLTHDLHTADESLSIQTRPPVEVDLKTVSSAALARLIEEVRNEHADSTKAYDRAHNRHNR